MTKHTSPVKLEKWLEDYKKLINEYNKEVQTLTMALKAKKGDISALRAFYLSKSSQCAIAEGEKEIIKKTKDDFIRLLACIKRKKSSR